MRAMSLAADDGESEQNEFRNLQLQLENTNKLVQNLSQQLAELKEQVRTSGHYIYFFQTNQDAKNPSSDPTTS